MTIEAGTMNKNEFAKASETPKKRSAWVIAGMTALTVGASIVGPEIVDEIQNETGSNNEPRSAVESKQDDSPLTKIGNILFDSRSASADAINAVTDANGGTHSFQSSESQVQTNFTGSGTGFSNATSGSTTITSLTNGSASNQGAIAFNKQMDMRSSWDITFNLNLTKLNTAGSLLSSSAKTAGDFVGLVLAPISPTSLGTSGETGGGLGLKGIANAYQWGIDFWYNQDQGDPNNIQAATDYGVFSDSSDGTQVAGFRTTDSSGILNTVSGSTGFTSFDHGTAGSVMRSNDKFCLDHFY